MKPTQNAMPFDRLSWPIFRHMKHSKVMSTERKFGVACKNAQCSDYIVLGIYSVPAQPGSDLHNWTGPWKLTCPSCGSVYDYGQADLVSP